MKFWTKTIFWENIKRSIAVFTGPTVVTLHELRAADTWIMLAGVLGFLGGLISIWMTDNDKNGTVDLFQ